MKTQENKTNCNAHEHLVNQLKHAKLCIESLGSQLEKYHVPAWQYKQTLEHIDSSLAKAGVKP